MITMKEWMELIGYRTTDGSEYGWQCYGPNARSFESWDGCHDGHIFSMVFDTKTQTVYEVTACDMGRNRCYRMIHPDFQKKHRKEARRRDIDPRQAWDDVAYVDLEVVDDFVQKCQAILAGEDYSTDVSIPLEFTDAEMLRYMTLAHEADLTFNDYVNLALRTWIDHSAAGPKQTKADMKNKKNKMSGKL